MTTPQADMSSALERAELIVAQLEENGRRVLHAGLARTVELVEDVWAEARSRLEERPEERSESL